MNRIEGQVASDTRIMALLRSLYALELRGETMFALMLENGGSLTLEQRGKVEACRLLLIEMAESLSNHITLELGLPLACPDELVLSPISLSAVHAGSWRARMTALEAAVVGVIAHFRELKALYSARQPRLCNTLLAQALVIRDFAHREADGDADRSLGCVMRLLGEDGKLSLARFQA